MTDNGASGEDALLSAALRALGPAALGTGVLAGIGDDAAVLAPPPGLSLVATVDMLVEGQHFLLEGDGALTLEDIGWRTLAVNLSDIAAMGARPLWALSSLGVRSGFGVAEMERLYSGMAEAARAHGVAIVGGNMARVAERLIVDITVIGACVRPVRRTGAVVGDRICVTGRLGSAAAGLAVLRRAASASSLPESVVSAVLSAQRRPTPRIQEGLALAALPGVRAMCDISDGLCRDLSRLCARGLGAVLWRPALPVPSPVRAVAAALDGDPVAWALRGGEDYELLCAIAPGDVAAAQAALSATRGAELHVIGEFVPGEGLWMADGPGGAAHRLQPTGWDPFL